MKILLIQNGKGKIVIRKSNNVYNQSLVASLIKNNGKKATAEWAKGVVANMARDSKGNDRAQILAVAAGEADLAVANTYYLALNVIWTKREQNNKQQLRKLNHSFQIKMEEELT